MKKPIIATLILGLAAGSALANSQTPGQSNAHDYHPGAINNTERLGEIDPNYRLTLPSERDGYTAYDNPYMAEQGTYSDYHKPNPSDPAHVADPGSIKITHGPGGLVSTEYTIKNGEFSFSVMCGYTSGPAYWSDSKPAEVCQQAQAMAKDLEAKGKWHEKRMAYTVAPAKIKVDTSS
ncbi:hypothetical protein [Motilimonas pumila]|uniref:Uncharacterized protein n=1 Tax=Motilimonas pumila TaxID=2303987 RepID=A0A418YDJ8_9GAMM|nr:hypothetical protein [Motilimonas pumila]RJG42618.1 hypothetical protein D1Z90_12175 [Motilimonas pumila]